MKVKVRKMSQRTIKSLCDYNNELYQENRDLRRSLQHAQEDVSHFKCLCQCAEEAKEVMDYNITQMERTIEDLRQEIESLNNNLISKEEYIATLEANVRAEQAKNLNYKDVIKHLNTTCINAYSDKEELRNQVSDLTAELQDRKARIDFLETRLEYVIQQIPKDTLDF